MRFHCTGLAVDCFHSDGTMFVRLCGHWKGRGDDVIDRNSAKRTFDTVANHAHAWRCHRVVVDIKEALLDTSAKTAIRRWAENARRGGTDVQFVPNEQLLKCTRWSWVRVARSRVERIKGLVLATGALLSGVGYMTYTGSKILPEIERMSPIAGDLESVPGVDKIEVLNSRDNVVRVIAHISKGASREEIEKELVRVIRVKQPNSSVVIKVVGDGGEGK